MVVVCANGSRGPGLKGIHLKGTQHQEARPSGPDAACATILMAMRRVLGVLKGGFGDKTMAVDLPQTNSCAPQSHMLHIGLKETTNMNSIGWAQ